MTVSAPDQRELITRIPRILYGGDYNPEQWPEETWVEDADLMREAGVNLVSLGIFAWARIEPAAGRYEFEWLDRVIDLLASREVSVNLATPTASPPPWLVRRHPDILPITIDGQRLWHGSRRHYCPHSAAYRDAVTALVSAEAEHYRGHPSLVAWHVDNEFACHFSECFCDASAEAFRTWLVHRYGSVDRLNEAWGSSFWGQRYSDWAEIQAPRLAPTFVNPTQRLDWTRFWSDSWLSAFDHQAAILRSTTPGVPVTTNFMGFHKPVDYWQWAPHEDVVANDSYPDTSEAEWMVDAAMVSDLMRSLGGGRPWILMEQATGYVNWRARNATKRPGIMRLGSYQAVARGADAVMFFQWRASTAGAEKLHSAMLPHSGTTSRAWAEVKTLGTELRSLADVAGSRIEASVAIAFDWQNWWAFELEGKPSNDLRLLPHVRGMYAALFEMGLTVEFVHPEADLSTYRLIVVPNLYLVTDEGATNISSRAADGGTVVMTYLSGIVDSDEHVRLGGYPGPFRSLLGLEVEEFVPHADEAPRTVRVPNGPTFTASKWSDAIRLEGAEALAVHAEDFIAGRPAVTEHKHGQGTAYYVGTDLDRAGLRWLLQRAAATAGIPVPEHRQAGVEVVERSHGTDRWLFVLNYTSEAIALRIDGSGTELLTGRAVDSTVRLGPADVAVVHMSSS